MELQDHARDREFERRGSGASRRHVEATLLATGEPVTVVSPKGQVHCGNGAFRRERDEVGAQGRPIGGDDTHGGVVVFRELPNEAAQR